MVNKNKGISIETDEIHMNNDEFAQFIREVLVAKDTYLMSTGTCYTENGIIKNELEKRIKKHPILWKLFFRI